MVETSPIILFSTIENLTNKVLNIVLWSFNLFLFSIGAVVILSNYENLNKPTGIEDCGNIFLMIGLSTINSLLIMIGFFKYLFISIFTFSSSFLLLSYNIYNIETINKTCIDYYSDNHNNIWVFNKICILLLIINLVLYIIKYINFIRSPVLDIEQPLLNNNDYINNTIVDNPPTDRVIPIENIYDDISNYNS